MFNDDWMRERGFLEEEVKSRRCDKDHIDKPLIVARTEELVSTPSKECVNKNSQIPVIDIGICRFLDETCFKVMYMIKTQPKKDQLRK
jgi:cystathionine beta-synthase